jgi:hypothetical protein
VGNFASWQFEEQQQQQRQNRRKSWRKELAEQIFNFGKHGNYGD